MRSKTWAFPGSGWCVAASRASSSSCSRQTRKMVRNSSSLGSNRTIARRKLSAVQDTVSSICSHSSGVIHCDSSARLASYKSMIRPNSRGASVGRSPSASDLIWASRRTLVAHRRSRCPEWFAPAPQARANSGCKWDNRVLPPGSNPKWGGSNRRAPGRCPDPEPSAHA